MSIYIFCFYLSSFYVEFIIEDGDEFSDDFEYDEFVEEVFKDVMDWRILVKGIRAVVVV